MKQVAVIGATGLVGRALVQQLLSEADVESVRVLVRRPTGWQHAKLLEHIVDFSDPGSFKTKVCGEVLFSALGTTVRQAGSQPAQYVVDHDYQLHVAQAALANGVSRMVIVSAAGASRRSPVFYSRMKGELEDELRSLGFDQLHILQPSFLDGPRELARPMERWGIAATRAINMVGLFRRWRPVPAGTVARAMVRVARHGDGPGTHVWKLDDLFALADSTPPGSR